MDGEIASSLPVVTVQRLSTDGAKYYLAMAQGDYYLKGGEPQGVWYGKGAEKLLLAGKVYKEEFLNLFNGFSPDGTKKLVQNAGKLDGYHARNAGLDVTCSDPKSVSVFWSQVPGDIAESVEGVHDRAVQSLTSVAEELIAYSRRGKGGKVWEKVGLVTSIFQHGTNRENEPQLHSHIIVHDIGVREDGTTGAIVTKGFFDYQLALGALYRCELSANLERELGLKTERVEGWFEITGVSRELQEAFSTRRKQILEFCNERWAYNAKTAEIAALETRPAKIHVPRSILKESWREIGREHGWSENEALALLNQTIERDPVKERERIIRDSLEELGRSEQFVTKAQVIETFARHAQASGFDAKQVLAIVEEVSKTHDLRSQGKVKHQEVFATATNVQEQEEVLSLIAQATKQSVNEQSQPKQGEETVKGEVTDYDLTKAPGLIQVVTDIPESDREKVLRDAKQNWLAQGFDVYELNGRRFPRILWELKSVGLSLEAVEKTLFQDAPNWNPLGDFRLPHLTLVLERNPYFGQTEAWVKTRFFTFGVRDKYPFADAPKIPKIPKLRDIKTRALVLQLNKDPFGLRKRVAIILDEASKVSSYELKVLVKTAVAAGAKLVLTDKQKNVPSGGLLARSLEIIRSIFHSTNIRFGIGETYPKTFDSLAYDWGKKGIRNPQQSLILTETRGSAHLLNLLAQRERLRAGKLATDFMLMGDFRIHRHDRVRFSESSSELKVKTGDSGTVTRVGSNKVRVFMDDGRFLNVKADSCNFLELGYAMTHWEASNLNRKRSFILFEGLNPEQEMAEIHRRASQSKTRVYGAADAVSRISRAESSSRGMKTKPTFDQHKQEEQSRDSYYTH